MKRCGNDINAHRYVDGMLSDAEAGAFEKHLSECAECGALVADLRKLSEIFGSKERVLPAPGFRERVLRAAMSGAVVDLAAVRRNSIIIMMKRVTAAAACLCFLMCGSIFFLLSQNSSQSVAEAKIAANITDGTDMMASYLSPSLTTNEVQFISGEKTQAVESYLKMMYQ